MGEQVDRRGFMRFLRRSDTTADEAEAEAEAEREPTLRERQIQEMAELSARLLNDVASEDEEQLGHGPVLTKAHDQAYIRITANHIVSSAVTGFSSLVKTSDVTAFHTDEPYDAKGYGNLVIATLFAHHPADLPTVTRSYAFRFPEGSPLLAAIRTACNLPEPEPAEAAEGEPKLEPEPGTEGYYK
jgi:hypothetical protein